MPTCCLVQRRLSIAIFLNHYLFFFYLFLQELPPEVAVNGVDENNQNKIRKVVGHKTKIMNQGWYDVIQRSELLLLFDILKVKL